jgi:hypothetical protein
MLTHKNLESSAKFRFGRPCAGWGPAGTGAPGCAAGGVAPKPGTPPGYPAAAYAAGHPCPEARAAGLEAGGRLDNQSRRERTRSGSTYCRVGGPQCKSVSSGPEPGPEVCAGREAYPSD